MLHYILLRCCNFYILILHLRTGCVRDGGQGRDWEREPMGKQGTVEDGVLWRNWVQWENGKGGRSGERQ